LSGLNKAREARIMAAQFWSHTQFVSVPGMLRI
jgi:hypothetical protein